jgi:hypothetical protein
MIRTGHQADVVLSRHVRRRAAVRQAPEAGFSPCPGLINVEDYRIVSG